MLSLFRSVVADVFKRRALRQSKWVYVAVFAGLLLAAGPFLPSAVTMAQTVETTGTIKEAKFKFVNNGGVHIAYREYGSGPLLILIHGFPDTDGTWSRQIKELSRDHLVVTPRLRGFPPSSISNKVEDYQVGVVADDIRALVRQFGDQKAIVIGHDWGGAVAQAFTLKYPTLVSGLAIMNVPLSATFGSVLGVSQQQQSLASYTVPYINYRNGDEIDTDFVVRNIRDPQWRSTIGAYLREQPLEGMLSYYKANYPAPPYKKQEPHHLILQVPTLILWGMEDEYFSLDVLNDAARYVATPLTLVTVPDAGHWVFQDAPDVVNRTIRNWIAGLR